MVDQGDAQPKGPCQSELVNLCCLLPYQNHQWKYRIANAEEKETSDNTIYHHYVPCLQTLAVMYLHPFLSLVLFIISVIDFTPSQFARPSKIFSRCLPLSIISINTFYI
jgi:hypothetical protein